MSTPSEVRFIPVTVAQTIHPDDVNGAACGPYLADLIASSDVPLQDNDVVAISSKVASSLAGGLVRLDDVVPSRKARILGWFFGRDPRKTQLVLEQGKVLLVMPMRRIMRMRPVREMMLRRTGNPDAMLRGYASTYAHTFIVCKHAAYLDEAGIDLGNSPDGHVTVLPEDPCALAASIRDAVQQRLGVDVAVILTDTATTIGRVGSQDIAIGFAGIDPVMRETFSLDLFGTPHSGGVNLTVDSIAGMAGLIMGQTTERTPIVIVRGLNYARERDDEVTGMGAVAIPPGSTRTFVRMAAWSTLKFWLGSVLAMQPHIRIRRKPRS